jgi:hypothetical protein
MAGTVPLLVAAAALALGQAPADPAPAEDPAVPAAESPSPSAAPPSDPTEAPTPVAPSAETPTPPPAPAAAVIPIPPATATAAPRPAKAILPAAPVPATATAPASPIPAAATAPASPPPSPAAPAAPASDAERAQVARAALRFLDALVARDAAALAAASADKFSFDGQVETGRDAIRRAWREHLSRREGSRAAVLDLDVRPAADAVARYGPPPARVAPLASRGTWIAFANVSGRAVVVFLARGPGGWAAVGVHD